MKYYICHKITKPIWLIKEDHRADSLISNLLIGLANINPVKAFSSQRGKGNIYPCLIALYNSFYCPKNSAVGK